MNTKIVTLLIAGLLTGAANAQYIGTLPPNIEGAFNFTTDNERFATHTLGVGAVTSTGFGVRYTDSTGKGRDTEVVTGTYRYTNGAPAAVKLPNLTMDTHLRTQSINAVYVHVDEDYSITGSVGVAAVEGSVRGTNLVVGSSSHANTELVADVDVRLIMTDSLTLSIIGQRAVVETAGNAVSTAIAGDTIMANTLAMDVDLQLSEHLSTYARVGGTRFTGAAENTRWFVNSKTAYAIIPEHGISIYGRVRYQTNTTIYENVCREVSETATTVLGGCVMAPYFSPKEQWTVQPGIQIRQVHNGLVYTGALEYGRQWITTDATVGSNAYGWQLGVQTQPGKRTGTTFGVNLFGTNTTGSSDYRWFGLYSWMKVPF